MISKRMNWLCVAAVAFAGLMAEAATTKSYNGVNYVIDGDIEPGVWTRQFTKAKAYADENHVPMVVFWGNDGCGYCKTAETDMSASSFVSWQKQSGYVFVFAVKSSSHGPGTGDDKEASEAKKIAKDPSGNFPYIGVYWLKEDGKSPFKKTMSGRAGAMVVKSGDLGNQLMKSIDNYLGEYKPNAGGSFALDGVETDGNRFEVKVGATKVAIPLTREGKASTLSTTDTLEVKNASEKVLGTYAVSWAKGDATKSVTIDVPSTLKAGDKLTLVLNDDTKGAVHVTAVSAENSTQNPDFSGCTAFGRWTMDLDAAKAYASGKSGLVLVNVQGGLWCPDCANVDRNFLDLKDDAGQNRFQAWAARRKLALVTMDIPNYNGPAATNYASPCLLSRKAVASTLARANEYPQSGAAESLTKALVRSGLGFQTRNGIAEADATARLNAFHDYAVKNTDEGGFHRPEDGNKNRTDVPIFVLLRADGTVVARLTRLASVSPMKADQANFDNYCKRIDEMIATVADASEIENNWPSAKSIVLKTGGSAEGKICNADFQDTFVLDGITGNAGLAVTVSGATAAQVSCQFMTKDKLGNVSYVGSPVSGALNQAGGVKLSADFGEVAACYVMVKGADITAKDYDVASETADHFTSFTVTADEPALIPTEAVARAKVTAGKTTLKMSVTTGVVYRVTNIKGVEGGKMTSLGDDIWKAIATEQVTLNVDDATKEVEYQIWTPGEIGFVETSRTVPESINDKDDDWLEFKVARTGGKSGAITAEVVVDDETENMEGRYELLTTSLTWDDSDASNKVVKVKVIDYPYYLGEGKLVLALSTNAVVAAGKGKFTLHVEEEDAADPGSVRVNGALPYSAKEGTVYAKESEGAKILVERFEACDGLVAVELKSSVPGTKYETEDPRDLEIDSGKVLLYWASREMGEKYVRVSGIPAGKTATVKLVKFNKDGKTCKVVSKASSIKVVSVADDAPEFASEAYSFDVPRYTAFGGKKLSLKAGTFTAGGTLTATKLSGTLPSGLKAEVDAESGALTFTGAPTKAGTYQVYYQVSETRGGKKVAGLPVKVTFNVTDVSKLDPKDNPMANPSIATSRTLEDLLVLTPEEPARLAGVLKLTIPTTGKVSAKYTCAGGSISFSAKNWDEKTDVSNGTLTATPTTSKKGYSLEVEVRADGSVEATVVDPAYGEQELKVVSDGQVWKAGTSKTAKAWEGVYVATLIPGGTVVDSDGGGTKKLSGGVTEQTEGVAPRGAGYLSFKMSGSSAYNKGKVTWAGVLANGTSVSGSAVLTAGGETSVGKDGFAYVPVYKKSSSDILGVVAEIAANAAQNCTAAVVTDPEFVLGSWTHTEKTTAANASYDEDLHIYGSYYDKNKTLVDCCSESYVEPDGLTFSVDVSTLLWAGYDSKKGVGAPTDVTPVSIQVKPGSRASSDKLVVTTPKAGNPQSMTLSLSRSTGIVSGTFKLPYRLADGTTKTISAKWKGVLLTGWGCECDCGEAVGKSVYLPFVNGHFSFSDKLSYEVMSGSTTRIKTLTVKRGGGASVGSTK